MYCWIFFRTYLLNLLKQTNKKAFTKLHTKNSAKCHIAYLQFYGQGETYTEVLDVFNMIFTVVFTLEMFLKLPGLGFKVNSVILYLANCSANSPLSNNCLIPV